jgi:NodT family efflux transporter outer membrane factor (OMF) lipoprotein
MKAPSLPRSLLPTLAVLPVLAACTIGPGDTGPDTDGVVAASWRAEAPPASPVWPSEAWWTGFRSPELDALIAQARSANFDILAAAARIRQADAALVSAGAPLLPNATGTAQDQWNRNSIGHSSPATGSTGAAVANRYYEYRTYSLTPSVSYEVDLWGRLRATRDAALATALANRFDQQTVALTAVTGVATTWFQALAYQDRLDVARRNLTDAEEILHAIRARLDAGTASQLDVEQQAALVAGIRASIPNLRSQMQQQINGLGILTGQPPEAITMRPGTLNTLSLPEVAPGLPSDLLARRPDVATAEANLASARASIGAARAAMFPKVELTATGGWQAFTLGTLFGPGSLFAQAAIGATQTIFDNGALQANVEQSRGRADELLADYRKAIVQAFTDVENALTAYRFATEQEALERDAVATAQRAADIARAQVQAGTSDMVAALQAQNTLYADLDTLAQVRLSRFTALVDLYKALGGGWTRAGTAPPETSLYQGVL